jgi:uncharacterized protein
MARAQVGPVDVWELSRQRGSVAGELALADAPRLCTQLTDADGVLRFRLSGLRDRLGRPAATLEVHGTVRARCDRCGRPVELAISESARLHFVREERDLGRLPIDESDEEALLGSERFDLASLVEDQAILALPISPRHEHCAAPQESDGPPPAEQRTHRPFAALAGLKKPGK